MEKFLTAFIIGIYPLLLFEWDMGSFHIQSFLLFFMAMGVLLYNFLQIRSKQWKIKMSRSRLELSISALAIFALFKIVVKIFTASETEAVYFDFELTVLAMAALYVLLAARPKFEEWYFDILLFGGLLVFAMLLVHYLCGDMVDGFLTVLLQGKEGVASYTMLVCVVGLWQYCRCNDKLRSIFYIGVLGVGFLVLFINQGRVSIYMMMMAFIVLPVLQRPTAELVKKDMQMFFLFVFMLCNMSLLTNYTNLLQVDVHYDLEQSVYLELVVAMGGLVFFKFWDRIPEGMDLKRLVMRKLRRGYQFLLKALAIIFAGILIGGAHWKNLPESWGMKALKGLAIPLVDEVYQTKSAFYLAFEKLGIIGGMLLLIMCVLLISRLRKNCRFDKPVTNMLTLISTLFLFQLLFWKVSINSLPVYSVFAIWAVTYKEEREKVTISKIKFE